MKTSPKTVLAAVATITDADMLRRDAKRSGEKIAVARAMLAEVAVSGDLRRIADGVVLVAKAEGAAAAWSIAVDGLDTDDVMGARKRITAALLRGADDTWSGRTNDTLRSYADGFREAARDALAALDLV